MKSELTLNDVKTTIEDISNGYSLTCEIFPIWSAIIQRADEVGHFASEIVERAMSHKPISEKQAWVIAYFAKNNNLLN